MFKFANFPTVWSIKFSSSSKEFDFAVIFHDLLRTGQRENIENNIGFLVKSMNKQYSVRVAKLTIHMSKMLIQQVQTAKLLMKCIDSSLNYNKNFFLT